MQNLFDNNQYYIIIILKLIPNKLTESFNNNQYILIIHNGIPFGVALPFSAGVMEQGLMPWMALKAFEAGDLSLGQLANSFGQLNIPIADYDLQEDLEAIKKL
jgi:hypothetical protein